MVEDVEAKVPSTAMRQWRRGTAGIGDGGVARVSAIRCLRGTEREGEGKPREKEEEFLGYHIHTGLGNGSERIELARARTGTDHGGRYRDDDRVGFAGNPLFLLFFFCSSPFSFLFFCVLFKYCSKTFN